MTVYVVMIVICIVLSAYFSATETAFSSLNTTRLKTMADRGDHAAALVLSLYGQYDKLISTILIGNNIVNIASASLATLLFVELLGDIGATVSTVVLTIVVLIFGEITPKSIAKDCPEAFAKFSAPFMKVLMVIMIPLTFVFSCWKKFVSGLMKLQSDDKMSQEELLTLVDEVEQNGSIDRDEGQLLHNAITFTDCTAAEILTHRTDLEAVSEDTEKAEIARRFTDTRYSRMLVYRENIDHIIGVIHIMDFYSDGKITDKPVSELLSPVIFVAASEQVSSLLSKMQEKKVHVSVVLDEYGGTCGIVTMEDILEEIVGEIWDEHDEATEEIRMLEEGKYHVLTSVSIDDFFAFFNIRSETDASTLNGWLAEQLADLPKEHDSFVIDNHTITVTGMERHRVISILVENTPCGETDEAANGDEA